MARDPLSSEEAEGLVFPSSDLQSQPSKRFSRRQSSGMESSVFRFYNVNFTAGQGDKQRHLLKDVTGKVRYGRKWISTNGTELPVLNRE